MHHVNVIFQKSENSDRRRSIAGGGGGGQKASSSSGGAGSADVTSNLVLHGLQADWIEEEMDDDPDFKKDVLEHRIKTLLKEEVSRE